MAERVGFEPTLEFPLNTLSKRAPSATRPSLRRRMQRERDFCASVSEWISPSVSREDRTIHRPRSFPRPRARATLLHSMAAIAEPATRRAGSRNRRSTLDKEDETRNHGASREDCKWTDRSGKFFRRIGAQHRRSFRRSRSAQRRGACSSGSCFAQIDTGGQWRNSCVVDHVMIQAVERQF